MPSIWVQIFNPSIPYIPRRREYILASFLRSRKSICCQIHFTHNNRLKAFTKFSSIIYMLKLYFNCCVCCTQDNRQPKLDLYCCMYNFLVLDIMSNLESAWLASDTQACQNVGKFIKFDTHLVGIQKVAHVTQCYSKLASKFW